MRRDKRGERKNAIALGSVFGGTMRRRGLRLCGVSALSSCLALSALCAEAAGAAKDAGNRVLADYALRGSGSVAALRLDAQSRRLYVALGESIEALDADSGKQLGSLHLKSEAEGLALSADGKTLAATSRGGEVAMIEAATLKLLRTARTGGNGASSAVFDGVAGELFVADTGSGSVAAIDGATGKLMATIEVGGAPGEMVANGYGRLYVADAGKDAVHVIDTNSLKALGDFPLLQGERCGGLALDAIGRRLFVACESGNLAVIDTDVGFTFFNLPIGAGKASADFTFAPQGSSGWKGAVFVASADGELAALKMVSFVSYATGTSMTLPKGISAVVFDPKTMHLLVAAPANGADQAGSNGKWEILAVAQ